ncbi:MAG: 2-C-methyl-D-erythritol 2,4-cyclodiphosphate synthase, partial [Sphingobacteriales bacterium]
MNFRVGFGYDVHQLGDGDNLILGGIRIPSHKYAIGHSDADVLIHVICDALLGAANLRDIGYNFPDTDNSFKGIDSKILLRKVMELVREKGFLLGNIDATICLQLPKINPHIPEMKKILSEVMHTDEENISIKATTTEKLGFVGREEGIS